MLSGWIRVLPLAGVFGMTSASRMIVNPCEGLSPASKYICENPEHCGPLLSRSTCSDEDYKGLVVFYHGFSACPAQAVDITPPLQDACLDVFVPTIPGHGGKVQNCTAGEVCDVTFWEGSMGFDQRTLPSHASKYREFVAQINEVVKAELALRAQQSGKKVKDLQMAVIGLSMGASAASYGVSLEPGLFTRQLLLNPYFGMGQEGVDQAAWGCLRRVERGESELGECEDVVVQKWFENNNMTISENKPLRWIVSQWGGSGGAIAGIQQFLFKYLSIFSDYPPADGATSLKESVDKFMDKETVWGENCWKIVEQDRGGFCAFRMKNMLATHAFGMNALAKGMKGQNSDKIPVTQIVSTERDGFTRNGLAYALASNLAKNARNKNWFTKASESNSVGHCMYRYTNGTDLTDWGQYWALERVMPHANLVTADNPGDPSVRWWADKLFRNVVAFASGEVDNLGEDMEGSDRNTCVDLPLESGSVKNNPWLRNVVLPEAAVKKESDLKPDLFWRNLVLGFDWWAKNVGCPNFEESLTGVVDCDQFEEQKPEAPPRCCCMDLHENATETASASLENATCKLFKAEDLSRSWNPVRLGEKVCPGMEGWHHVSRYDEITVLPPACLVHEQEHENEA